MRHLIVKLVSLFQSLPYLVLGLIARLAVGLVFWNSGRTKVDGWNIFSVNDKTLFLFTEEYKLPVVPPELAALAAQISEHVFPLLLFVGLATRFSALALLIMTLTIQIFVYPNAYVEHGLWAAALLTLIKFGPGMISADHVFLRR